MKKVKLGIIGCGNIGSQHYSNVLNGKCPEIEVTAIADLNPDRLAWAENACKERQAKGIDVKLPTMFSNASEMLKSGLIEAVIISVPHYSHPGYAIEAM